MKEIRMSDVLELPVAERLKLVEAIWDSIAESAEAIPLTDEQRTELDRRFQDYEKDPEAGSPWPEVKARILKLSVAERLQLVGDIWDDIAADAPESVELTEAQRRELRRRLAEHDAEPDSSEEPFR
jgi:putative addiction module component (TIGR02574 family)